MIQNISLVGAGNLATQLGKALKQAGLHIIQVYSRTETSAKALAAVLECPYTTDLSTLLKSDLVIVSVKDDALEQVLSQIKGSSKVVHTGGSVPMDILASYFNKFGVFYPLQTFSKKRDVDFSSIPICLEANTPEFYDELQKLADRLSKTVSFVNSEQRKILHLAAVFTCNFVNHFYQIGDSLLEDKGMDFSMLQPLILETAQKVKDLKPIDAQTGPAVRFDETIINKHLNLLSDKPELQKIYSFVSESIYQTKNSK
ncbi:Rossmann-like and DUF2520 domain-containing protein [Sunxiuqinia sp. sy24]|uniref:Rossmann-like and DUF2520 domain-containing protein n=1 Tax=Sunxiuqinia sp. sy24 TaxID=3461495 RepID=UPI0040457062